MTTSLAALAWRTVRARPARTSLTILAIALGVAVVAAALATSAAIDRAIHGHVAASMGRADLRVATVAERGLDRRTLTDLRTLPGVAAAAPVLERRTYPLAASAGLPEPVTVVGIDPEVEPAVRDLALADGVLLARRDERAALISARLAADDGYAVGSTIEIAGAGRPERFRVAGILAESARPGAGERLVVVPIAAAARTFAIDGVSRIDLVLDPAADPAATEAAIVERLTREPYVLSTPADLAATLRAATDGFRAASLLLALAVLVAAALLIHNSLAMSVGERTRELGLLRVAGVTRGQIARFVVHQGLVLGAAGSALGVGLGVVAGLALAAAASVVLGRPIDGPVPTLGGLAAAAAAGVLVTLVASLRPAVRAGRIPPIEAVKARAAGSTRGRSGLGWLPGGVLLAAFVALAAAPGSAEALAAVAVVGLLAAIVTLTPAAIRPLERLAGLPLRAILPLEERLARAALAKDRNRTTVTVAGLALGLAMLVAIGTIAGEARRAAAAWLTDVVPGDTIVTSIRPVGSAEGVTETLAGLPGVARVSPLATFAVAHEGRRLEAAAVSGTDLLDDGRLTFVEGDRAAALGAFDGGGTALVGLATARRLGLAPGDPIRIAIGGGRAAELTVAGVVATTLPGESGETILVSWIDGLTAFGVAGADAFAVRFEPAATAVEREALAAESALLALEARPVEAIAGAASATIARVVALLNVLALVAVLVAALGVANTLSMSVVERVRELGILRAAGMTRRQVVRSIAVEAGLLGAVASAVGIAAGLGIGGVIVAIDGDPGAIFVDPPWAVLGLATALGIGVAVLAAAGPARLATRHSIVRAVRFE